MLHCPGPKILSEHVGAADHVKKDCPVGILSEIEDDGFSAAIDEVEIEGRILLKWSMGPRLIGAPQRSDFNDSSTEITQNIRA